MRLLKLLLAVTLFLALPVVAPGASPSASAAGLPVFAFYYPWYSPSQFTRAAMFDVPVQPYESDDRGVIERQVREARDAGITGFISSWMGKGNRTDHNFATLLDVARNEGFSATIYFETGADGLRSETQVVEALRYVMSTYGSHPAFAHAGGKPALFVWNPGAAGGPATWQSIRDQVDPGRSWHWNVETDKADTWLGVFDGLHLFSAASWVADASATYKGFRTKVDNAAARYGQPKVWAAGVAPGWDNSRQSNPTQVVVSRQDGAYYSARWQAALASNPDMITITSWNEWGEGTAIEPGSSYGNRYLDITRQFASSLSQAASASVASPYGFELGFKLLADQIPYVAGQPLENEHHNPENGDGLQQTSTGLMVWRKSDNWTAFTNGTRTWVNGPYGVMERSNDQRFLWEH